MTTICKCIKSKSEYDFEKDKKYSYIYNGKNYIVINDKVKFHCEPSIFEKYFVKEVD